MRNSIYKAAMLMLFFAAFNAEVVAQQTTLVKTLEQNFDVSPKVSFDLTNKYGDIVINGWDQSKVAVKIRITTYGKDDEDTRKLMDRVEFDFNVSKDYVVIETVLDRKKGFVADFFNTLGDYSKALLSKNELDIDFEVFVPHYTTITINNKFGDVVAEDLKGKVNLDLSHGNFKTGDLYGLSRINVNYGNIRINGFKNGYVTIKGGEFDLQKAEKINVKSSSSKLYLKDMGELMLESTSDNVRITNIRILRGNAGFSTIDVYNLSESCDYDQSYGEMVFHHVHKDFSVVKLLGKSTDYVINVDKDASFQADVSGREDKLLLVEKPDNLEKIYTDEKQKYVKITGRYGKNEASKSVLKVDTVNGEVSVDFTYVAK